MIRRAKLWYSPPKLFHQARVDGAPSSMHESTQACVRRVQQAKLFVNNIILGIGWLGVPQSPRADSTQLP